MRLLIVAGNCWEILYLYVCTREAILAHSRPPMIFRRCTVCCRHYHKLAQFTYELIHTHTSINSHYKNNDHVCMHVYICYAIDSTYVFNVLICTWKCKFKFILCHKFCHLWLILIYASVCVLKLELRSMNKYLILVCVL